MTVRRRLATPVGLVTALVLLLGIVAPVRATAEINWGAPQAAATFGTGIEFQQPLAATGLEARWIELLLTQPGVTGQQVRTVNQVGTISQTTLEYTLLESDSHIFPNATFSAQWRITDTDGNVYVGPSTSITYSDTRFDWKTQEGSLIRVHWYRGDDAFGRKALQVGEAGIAKAEDLLGVKESKPIDFFVYADLPAFYAALGPATPENVGGLANPNTRTLYALITPDQIDQSWVGTVIPHELTHLVFDTATKNPFHDPPHWLNEGLAVYLTEGISADRRADLDDAIRSNTVIPLTGLVGDFPGDPEKFRLSYAEAVSATDFIVRTYGRDALVKLVQLYATGVTDAQAFTRALGLDDKAFADAWLADIKAKLPPVYGPQPDAPGPLPSGWSTTNEAAPPAALPSLAASAGPSGAPGSPGATLAPLGSGGPGGSAAAPPMGGLGSPSAAPASGAPASGAPGPSAPPASGRIATIAPLATVGPGEAGGTTGRAPNPTLAIILGAFAIVFAGAGVALFAFRRQPQPR
jgi:hypothetical protein